MSRRKHRMRARRLLLERLRKAQRDAEVCGVDVEAIRANLRKTAAQIIAECDPELAVQDPATGPTCRPRAGCSRGG